MHTRRDFIGASAGLAAAAAMPGAGANAAQPSAGDKISLAAWSINQSYFRSHRWKNLELPQICREQFGIAGLEFVNQFFELPTAPYLRQLKKHGQDNGVAFVRIMVDEEGPMASPDKAERHQAAVAHRKWIDIAHTLGCQDIRCNSYGTNGTDWKQDRDFPKRAAESFSDLLAYSKDSGVDLCIENHGGASSDPAVLLSILKEVNDPRLGLLPDFGNINKGDDRYDVIRRLAPHAKGISVKASWRDGDTHPDWDLEKLIEICRGSGFHGWWGVESGYRSATRDLPPEQIWENECKGVRLTKAVIDRTVFKKA